MNPELPSNERERLEAQLTALILGELDADGAAKLTSQMAGDPELKALYSRLEGAIGLVRQASADMVSPKGHAAQPTRLSPEKREELFAKFKTVGLVFQAPKPSPKSWLVPIGVAAALAFIVIPMMLPALGRAKSKASAGTLSMARRSSVEANRNRHFDAFHTDSGATAAEKEVLANGKAPLPNVRFGGRQPKPSLEMGIPLKTENGQVTSLATLEPNSLAVNPQPPASTPVSGGVPAANFSPDGATVFNESLADALTVQPGQASHMSAGGIDGGGRAYAGGYGAVGLKPASEPAEAKAKLGEGVVVNGPAPIFVKPTGGHRAAGLPSLGVTPEAGRYFRSAIPAEKAPDSKDAPLPGTEAFRRRYWTTQSSDKGNLRDKRAEVLSRLAGPNDEAKKVVADQERPTELSLQQPQGQVDARLTQKSEAVRELAESRTTKQTEERQVLKELSKLNSNSLVDRGEGDAIRRDLPPAPAPEAQPEILTEQNPWSTFSLNVSDVSFKLAAAALENGAKPDPASVRSEEFINAFDYHDPEPTAGQPIAFAWERARSPFAQNRDLLRFSVKTAARGRTPGRSLNLVLVIDRSGSMERADRVRIMREALRALAGQLQAGDKVSVVTFARTARLVADGVSAEQAGAIVEEVSNLTPEGGTNLEEALRLGYATASKHFSPSADNRVILMTDGAANLGEVEPANLKKEVEAQRKQGIALDCFGIGWEGYNDDTLEMLSRNGDGRYAFINTPEEVGSDFLRALTGALQVAASDVKVQLEFNPQRVPAYRQVGYAKHQLTKEQFRDNAVDAAEIGAAEAGNAVYVVQVNPAGQGPLGTVRVRYKIPGTEEYKEHEFTLAYEGNAPALEDATPAMKLAAVSSAFSEWLAGNPYAGQVAPDQLSKLLNGVPEVFGQDARPRMLQNMIQQAAKF